MFCPQCRLSWPKGSAGTTNLLKSKRKTSNSPEWGSALLCPNCLVPLAADRIQGEFPSVAHASSTKEGTMTIKDVLRESGLGGATSGEVPLDDKKHVNKARLFGKDANGKPIFLPGVASMPPRKQQILRRLLLMGISVLCCLVITFGVRAMISGGVRTNLVAKAAANGHAVAVPAPSIQKLTASETALLKVMPTTVGNWSRSEADADIWNVRNVSTVASQTFTSTYKSGNDTVQLWATRIPTVQAAPPLTTFEGVTRVVHTSDGAVYVNPKLVDTGSSVSMVFDYNASTTPLSAWIQTGQFTPPLAHTISWYAPPFIITVASQSKDDRDAFVTTWRSASL
jgi:hypothetical protein